MSSYTSPTMAKTPQTSSADVSHTPVWRSPLVLWGAAALCLILGFVDLWRGGETLSAILLTVGYLVLVPIAILKR